MSPKVATFLILALFLCSSLTHAARLLPPAASLPAFSRETQHGDLQAEQAEVADVNCESAEDEDCLIRRTLAAHVDYIYTQKEKP